MPTDSKINTEPSYSVIIPAFNEAQELPATLAAVRTAMSAQAVPGEIVVVDNNSTDDTADVARAHGADHVVFEPVNQIARARNSGANQSRGRHLIFVDADTRISPGLLAESLDMLASGRFVGGGSIIQFEGPISAVGRFGIGLWERISKLTQIAAGSYLFCRADAFREVDGFDERLYASEEVRLSRLLKKWGRRKGLRFEIIRSSPARTSARKLNWYSGPQILGWVFFMMLFPLAVRWRKLCGFWYRRPEVHS
ncbi:glycosyl transferase family 2 [Coraliomargarita sinensis]|uniref:Glycosyl transferase family 2 n=1 Tax=Coraliomargarita sinensis TaxID=2174842 RepID=A0A317ZIH1_9BACT|nr:glycosyltransferase [Coraliomargarita sinensis]PXA05514.1 glycosyl transferase family 2 [Coraliomargarita sinensis]